MQPSDICWQTGLCVFYPERVSFVCIKICFIYWSVDLTSKGTSIFLKLTGQTLIYLNMRGYKEWSDTWHIHKVMCFWYSARKAYGTFPRWGYPLSNKNVLTTLAAFPPPPTGRHSQVPIDTCVPRRASISPGHFYTLTEWRLRRSW